MISTAVVQMASYAEANKVKSFTVHTHNELFLDFVVLLIFYIYPFCFLYLFVCLSFLPFFVFLLNQ